jgi:hypothetical protein
MGDQGNVIQSKGFQFTVCEAAFRDVEDGHWRPEKPEKPTKATDTWIYAIGYVLGQKGKLAGEYHADKKGALTFVPGDTRRNLEPSQVKTRTPKPEAGLPVIIQGKPVRYSFVVTRGQMGTDAIWDMENSIPQLYGDFDLADDASFVTDSNNQLFLPVVDALSIGEGLNKRYQAERDRLLFYKKGKPDDKNDQAAADTRNKQYQLAKMINDKLYDPPGGPFDPLGLGDSLAGRGKAMTDRISDYEKVIKLHDDASRYAARRLVAFLNSPLWIQPYEWYLDSTEKDKIGHYWLEGTSHSIHRLSETPEGRELLRQMVRHNVPYLNYFFRPDDDLSEPAPQSKEEKKEKEKKEDDEQSEFYERFLIARKAATAGVIAFGELAPAMVVYGKVREAAKRRVIDSIVLFLDHTEIRAVVRSPSGDVVRFLHARIDYLHLEINWTQAKADVAEWVEQGKPHWPESKANDVLGRLFIACEMFNLASCLTSYFDARKSSTSDDAAKRKAAAGAVGALLDVACALEDPIRGVAKEWDATRAAFKAPGEAAAEGGEEAEGILTKLTHPVVFKALGAISAAIDFYYSFEEVAEAKESGEQGMVVAKRATQIGSALILGASILNGVGYIAEAALLTAAASALLVAGVFIVAVGWALTTYFSKTMWQKFAKHCTFGIEPGGEGKENWSGGEFSEWANGADGLVRQIQVLTAMTCSFKISGTSLVQGEGNGNSSDWESISVEFSGLPPGAKLHLFFELSYEGVTDTYYPEYALELESGLCTREGQGAIPTPKRYFAPNGVVNHVVFSADRPAWATGKKITKSACTVFLQYAPKAPTADVATGVIPIGGRPCRFVIYDGYGVDLTPVSSLEYKQH